jgi:uncharacterized protein
MAIDYNSLWSLVVALRVGHATSIHGPEHWRRVERNGLLLAADANVDVDVVKLFALFHDSRRESDGWDPDHGARGASFAADRRGDWYELSDDRFELLHYACTWHTDGKRHDDPTIAACWDADRLDLGRVGIMPDPKRMCTKLGAEIARVGSVPGYLAIAGLSS